MADYTIGVYTSDGFGLDAVSQDISGTFTADPGLQFSSIKINDDDSRFQDLPGDWPSEDDNLDNQTVSEDSQFFSGDFKFTVPAGAKAYAVSHYTITSVNGAATNFQGHTIQLQAQDGAPFLREDLETGEIVEVDTLHLTSFTGVPAGMMPRPGDEIGFSATTNSSSLGEESYAYGPVDYNALQAPCFCTGSMIRTPSGDEIPVEKITAGMLVLTADGEKALVKWVGKSESTCAELINNPKLRPIRIRQGALGPNSPVADLYVSPQHRMLIKSAPAQSVFGNSEILVPAGKLTFLEGIDQVDESPSDVYYHHILFDRHQVIYANAAPTESLFLGEMALSALSPDAIAEIKAIFPELRVKSRGKMAPARPIVERRKDIESCLGTELFA